MRVLFVASADLACPTLNTLLRSDRHTVAGIVTQPDRPKGRDLKVSPCAVSAFASDSGIRILTPENINSPESLAGIRDIAPELIIVIAYGQFLKSELLHLPPRGCINLHASLLPAYRGAAPIQWAIANGERETGVTVMYINDRMDAGDIILQERMPIEDDDTAGSLHDRMADQGALLMTRALDAIEDGTVHRVVQDETRVSFARKLTKADGKIDWSKSSGELYNHVRGFSPWPGCYCCFSHPKCVDASLKIFKTRIEIGGGTPGCLIDAGGEGPLVATGDGALRLLDVQPAGRKRMSGGDFLRGYKLKEGNLFT